MKNIILCLGFLICGCSAGITPDISRLNGDSQVADAAIGPGQERQPCYGNGTCDSPFVCASGLCVSLQDGGMPDSPTADAFVVDASVTPETDAAVLAVDSDTLPDSSLTITEVYDLCIRWVLVANTCGTDPGDAEYVCTRAEAEARHFDCFPEYTAWRVCIDTMANPCTWLWGSPICYTETRAYESCAR